MTALETLIGNFAPTTTLLLEVKTTMNVMQEADTEEERLTTLVLAASTILDQIEIPNIRINDTLSYVESLSDDELARADQLLSGLQFTIEDNQPVIEQPKTYVKSNGQNIL